VFRSSSLSQNAQQAVNDGHGSRLGSGLKPDSRERLRPKLKVRMTREGWQFAFMLVFIVFAAILQNINLLILLAGALAAMLFLQWRLTKRSLIGLSLTRQLPTVIEARQKFRGELILSNPRRWLGSWLLLVTERLHPTNELSNQESPSQMQLTWNQLPPNSKRRIGFDCQVPRRGRYAFEGSEISTRFPLSLMQGVLKVNNAEEIIVRPRQGELQRGWRELLKLPSRGIQQIRSKRSGGDGEFHSLRDYRRGDSVRMIHWRTSAKRNRLVVRQLERFELRTLILVVDLFRDAESSEFVTEVAATILTNTFRDEQLQVTFSIVSPHPRSYRLQSVSQLNQALDELALAECQQQDWLPTTIETLGEGKPQNQPLLLLTTRASPDLQAIRSAERSDTARTASFATESLTSTRDTAIESRDGSMICLSIPSERLNQIFVRG
jgi:uncharacterized protein (DUF58 family)